MLRYLLVPFRLCCCFGRAVAFVAFVVVAVVVGDCGRGGRGDSVIVAVAVFFVGIVEYRPRASPAKRLWPLSPFPFTFPEESGSIFGVGGLIQHNTSQLNPTKPKITHTTQHHTTPPNTAQHNTAQHYTTRHSLEGYC